MHGVFPFDLAFSMTVHKAQGRTLGKVVLDLTSHPSHKARFEFAALFVALSRVKNSASIRFLKHHKFGTPFDPYIAYGFVLHDDHSL